MDNIFIIIGAVITGLGGSSAIILGLSSWLGKVWANRIFEKEKVKYEKELQDYKSKIDIEMVKFQTMNEKALHTTKIQYDKEFEIYQNIWSAQIECFLESNDLFPDRQKDILPNEEKAKRYSKFIKALNKYHKEIHYNAPFYKDNFYKDFISIWEKCSEVGKNYKQCFESNTSESKHSIYSNYKCIFDEIKIIQESLRYEIQEYLSELRGDCKNK